jgi:membrane-associated progesterone receptor component
MAPRAITKAELAECDGVRTPRIFVAVDGLVFDVSKAPGFYGPGGNYHGFAGKDCTRALALGLTDAADVLANPGGKQGLTVPQQMKIDDWLDVFESKYPVVGSLAVEAVEAAEAVEAPQGGGSKL